MKLFLVIMMAYDIGNRWGLNYQSKFFRYQGTEGAYVFGLSFPISGDEWGLSFRPKFSRYPGMDDA